MSMLDSPFASFFEQLSERLRVPVTDETPQDNGARVEIEEIGTQKFGPCPYRLPGRKVIGRDAYTYLLHCYGDSKTEVLQRRAELIGHIDELVGPPQGTADVEGHHGYQVAAGKDGMMGGDGTGATYSCDVQLTLFLPVVSQIRGTAEGRATLEVTPGAPDASANPSTLEVL